MSGKKSIIALPSTVKYPTGLELRLTDLTEQELLKVRQNICRNASSKLSDYFSNNLTEWESSITVPSDTK